VPLSPSQGHTCDETRARIREAIELCLENQTAEGWELPAQVDVTTINV
jgi:predicted RNase H-like HicB family nuclease